VGFAGVKEQPATSFSPTLTHARELRRRDQLGGRTRHSAEQPRVWCLRTPCDPVLAATLLYELARPFEFPIDGRKRLATPASPTAEELVERLAQIDRSAVDFSGELRIVGRYRQHRPPLSGPEKADVARPLGQLLEGSEKVLPRRLVARVDGVDEVEAEHATEERQRTLRNQ
jgi:hypothetical protein